MRITRPRLHTQAAKEQLARLGGCDSQVTRYEAVRCVWRLKCHHVTDFRTDFRKDGLVADRPGQARWEAVAGGAGAILPEPGGNDRDLVKIKYMQELAEQKFHPNWMGNIHNNVLVGQAVGQ